MTALSQLGIEQIERDIAMHKEEMDSLMKQKEMLQNRQFVASTIQQNPQNNRRFVQYAQTSQRATSTKQTGPFRSYRRHKVHFNMDNPYPVLPSSVPKPSKQQKKVQTIPQEDKEQDMSDSEKKGRRPRALTLDTRMLLLRDLPTTLKGILDKYCLQEMALQHWLHKRPILVGDFQTIERALSRINAHEIRSLPVVNKDKIVVGLVDIMDIANSISESLKSLSELDEESAGKIRNEFMTTTVGNLLTQGKKKVFVASNRLTLMHAIECLVSTNQERVMIVDRDVEGFVAEQSQTEEFLDGMCTQADVVRFLSQNAALLRQDPHF
jgi:CBS domain-containing protein